MSTVQLLIKAQGALLTAKISLLQAHIFITVRKWTPIGSGLGADHTEAISLLLAWRKIQSFLLLGLILHGVYDWFFRGRRRDGGGDI